eukprot:TRINITY_DN1947_c0_g1_i1.p1 TRINITY_DN1947_c0_g1~~TRINITY_DN1947_c0_g1_i1.p1  ORF type:complete len:435 (-),score=60.05 TRINITY_DN1947_c0_g1_i1:314-1618(-)
MSNVVTWPKDDILTLSWLSNFKASLHHATWHLPASSLSEILPEETLNQLLLCAYRALHKEANIAYVDAHNCAEGTRVTLVGDVHGQFHDVLRLFEEAGLPGEKSFFVFNGDYVDRGAWGVETYAYLLAWKVFLPHRVILLRGNHESKYCASHYGFEREVVEKYGGSGRIFRRMLACFESHPLAAVVAGRVFVCHGGLFRAADGHSSHRGGSGKGKGRKDKSKSKGSRRGEEPSIRLGDLSDLASTRRSFLDPTGTGASAITSDVLWSDPGRQDGLSLNKSRGIGLQFGPDCTQSFLLQNKLKLIVRSHEGPDARLKQPEMESMAQGFTIDHVVQAGRLITLFSAPDYPQFQAAGRQRHNNKAAYLVLEGPAFEEPSFNTFEAVLPRPPAVPFYDVVNVIDSDDELDLPSSGESGDEENAARRRAEGGSASPKRK